MWNLWNDPAGDIIATGPEQKVKKAHHAEVAAGTPVGDLFLEAPDGTQWAWNPNVDPPGWDEV